MIGVDKFFNTSGRHKSRPPEEFQEDWVKVPEGGMCMCQVCGGDQFELMTGDLKAAADAMDGGVALNGSDTTPLDGAAAHQVARRAIAGLTAGASSSSASGSAGVMIHRAPRGS